MIGSSKLLREIKDKLDVFDSRLKDVENFNESLKVKLNSVEGFVSGFDVKLKDVHNDVVESFDSFKLSLSDELSRLGALNDEFEKRINNFKFLESNLQKKLGEKAEFELKDQLKDLSKTANEYKKIEKDIVESKDSLSYLNRILGDLVDISKSIRKEDFVLSKHAKNLELADKEKLNLIRENENLKRLIGKLRSNRT
ncbi:hypothetical protein K9L97_03415 [Candidatus Woesearchaeota archaeon]|nr:hypothetical protein [Candidatus Woesearchaeota archaeon]